MNKILVPTDFSDTANKALEFAVKLAKCFDSEIHLLNSYDVPHSGATLMISIDELLEKDSILNLTNSASKLKESHPSVKVITHSHAGPTYDVVLRFIKNNQIDLVVMGTTGAYGLKGKLFGSNTAGLIKNLKIPLMVIPHNAKLTDPNRMGISTDLKFGINDEVYDPARRIALAFGSKVSFFNITEHCAEGELCQIETDFGTDIDFVYGTDLEQGINDYLDEENIDLLVLVSEKHSLMHSIFKPSVTKTMAKHLNIPMLILVQKD